MLETRVFFGPTPKATREYAEWFASIALTIHNADVSIATRPFVEGGSETVIIVVYAKN